MKAASGVISRRLLRTKEAAGYLGCSAWKLRELSHNHQIAYVDYGDGPWLFDLKDLDAYIDGHKQPAK